MYIYLYIYIYIYIYIYLYIYHIEGAVFTTIWCSMYKVQSVDSIFIYIEQKHRFVAALISRYFEGK